MFDGNLPPLIAAAEVFGFCAIACALAQNKLRTRYPQLGQASAGFATLAVICLLAIIPGHEVAGNNHMQVSVGGRGASISFTLR